MKKQHTSGLVAIAVLIAMTLATTSSSVAAEKVYVGKNIPAAQQVSMDRIDHSAWDKLLQKYCDEKGNVNYKAWKASAADSQALDTYLSTLSATNIGIESTRNAQFAYWINAYNAVTVKGILREYPTKSIKDHAPKAFGYNIWDDLQLIVGDRAVSLNSMEHEVLRKMGDPRIHFAIVCASHSCPRLLNNAYTAEKLEQQLVVNTKNFFANQENFQYDTGRREFKLSSIMKWFGSDFGNGQAAQLRTISAYLPTQQAQAAASSGSGRVSYLPYDWSLNEQKGTAGSAKRQGSGGSARR